MYNNIKIKKGYNLLFFLFMIYLYIYNRIIMDKNDLILWLLVIVIIIYFLDRKENFGMPDLKSNYYEKKCGQVEGFGMPDLKSNYYEKKCDTVIPEINSEKIKEGFACPCALRMNALYNKLNDDDYENFNNYSNKATIPLK
jgi:hypothetical protein